MAITTFKESDDVNFFFENNVRNFPHLNKIFVTGLLKLDDVEAREMALTIARRYTNGTMFSCPEGAEVCNMFEKVRGKCRFCTHGRRVFRALLRRDAREKGQMVFRASLQNMGRRYCKNR